MLINKDISENNLSRITKETFNYLKYKFGNSSRIGDLVNLIEAATGVKLDLDYQNLWNSLVFSDLLDYQKDFMTDGIEFSELKEYIFRVLELPKRVIRILEKDKFEDRLLAIMLSISLPSHDYFKLETNND